MTTLLCAALMAVAVTAGGTEQVHLGGEFSRAAETPIEEVTTHPERFHNRAVRVSGIIASACNEEGCFIEVVPRGGGGGIVANFPGLVHTFPTDCAGLEATVEGVLYRKIYQSARVLHWQHHSYHAGKAIPEFSMILRMEVSAAEVRGPRWSVPELAEIQSASPFQVDLDREEFEDEGLGIGKKHLEAGIPRRQPGSATVRTLVACVAGAVSVAREGAPEVHLAPGAMAYVPPASPFVLCAESAAGADVLIIYADTIKREPEHQH